MALYSTQFPVGIPFDKEKLNLNKKFKTMSLIKFKHHAPARNNFDNFFNEFFEGEFNPRKVARTSSVPAANVKETEKGFHVELAAPGMVKEDFKIELNVDLLTIRAEKSEDKEGKGERFTKREFNFTSFERSFRLPENIDFEKINAKYENGILTLEIPKTEVEEEVKVRQIAIS
ncbi:MAG: HSP20 family protein [Cryomorphaceae bacterium]|jgi:HSP20 family protein